MLPTEMIGYSLWLQFPRSTASDCREAKTGTATHKLLSAYLLRGRGITVQFRGQMLAQVSCL
jgi:hypothetical protein